MTDPDQRADRARDRDRPGASRSGASTDRSTSSRVDGTTVRVRGDRRAPARGRLPGPPRDGRVSSWRRSRTAARSGIPGRAFRRCQPITVEVPRGARVSDRDGQRADPRRRARRRPALPLDLRRPRASRPPAGRSISRRSPATSGLERAADVLSADGPERVRRPRRPARRPSRTLQAADDERRDRRRRRVRGQRAARRGDVSGDVTLPPVGPVRVEGSTVSGDVESSLAAPLRRSSRVAGRSSSARAARSSASARSPATSRSWPARRRGRSGATGRHVAPAEAAEASDR